MICMLANDLCERGFTIHVVSWDEEDARSFFPLDHRVVWNRLDFQPGIYDKFRRTFALTKVLRREGIRVLIGFVMSGDKTVYAAAKLAGVRLVVAERNAPVMYWLRYNAVQRWFSFTLLHLADRIIVQMPDFVLGYPASLRGRIEIIPNPVPVALHKARPGVANDAGRFTLLTVSRLDGVQKQIDRLIKAFALIAATHSNWTLRIIGDGPERGALSRLGAECGVADCVKFDASTPDIFSAYGEAHLFVIPSLWEGFPNALAEAMSHGLPAVGFRGADGVAHLIEDGVSGWLADGMDDVDALAKTLNTAMQDAAGRQQRGAAAVHQMVVYKAEDQISRWDSLICDLVDAG